MSPPLTIQPVNSTQLMIMRRWNASNRWKRFKGLVTVILFCIHVSTVRLVPSLQCKTRP